MARKMKTMDGNTAAAHVSYAFTDVAAIYPITPSSPMADETDKWAADGQKNIFGREVQVTEMQSEAGAAGAVHGSLAAGALTTTYTASQGLLLMIPNMYKIGWRAAAQRHSRAPPARCRQPCPVHLRRPFRRVCMPSDRLCHAVLQQPARGYGPGRCGAPVPPSRAECRSSISSTASAPPTRFRRSRYGITKTWPICWIWDAVDAFRAPCPEPGASGHPRHRAEPATSSSRRSEAGNTYYDAAARRCRVDYMNKVNAKIGTDYKLFNYYGAPDAENVIIAMGSVCDTVEETVDYLNAAGDKVGLVKVRLYRPFSAEAPDRCSCRRP